MVEMHGNKLIEVFDKYSDSAYESKVSIRDDIIEIKGQPEGVRLQVALLLFFFTIPIVALIEDPSIIIVLFSMAWLIFFGRIFIGITNADLSFQMNLVEKTVEISNINPLIEKCRKIFRFRYSWEGRHKWSQFKQVVVRENKFGKVVSDKGHRLLLKGLGRKEYPIAEFTNAILAENVAYIVARITGIKYFKVRS